MAEHTPGPWRVNDHRMRTSPKVYGPWMRGRGGPRKIADIYGPGDSDVYANARLIAAAPDLLEACELEEEAERLGQIWGELIRPESGATEIEKREAKEVAFEASRIAIEKRKSAIAKVKGEPND